jgi:hypothetical protein
MALYKIGQGGLNQGVFIVAGVGEDVFVLDKLEIVNLELIAFADELDGLERSIPDINPPSETRRCHGVSSVASI